MSDLSAQGEEEKSLFESLATMEDAGDDVPSVIDQGEADATSDESTESSESDSDTGGADVDEGAATDATAESEVSEEETSVAAEGESGDAEAAKEDVSESGSDDETEAEALLAATPTPVVEVPQLSDEEALVVRTEARGKAIDQIASQYQMTEEETNLFMTAPEKIVPKLIAKVFVDVYEAVYTQIASQLPDAMQNMRGQEQTVQKYETDFYELHPTLKEYRDADPKNAVQVALHVENWRKLNPGKVTPEQAIKDAGKYASALLGLGTKAPTKTNKQPGKGKGKAVPHKPVQSGAAAAPSGDANEDNVFTQLALHEEDFEI